jgi:hypothetical protein
MSNVRPQMTRWPSLKLVLRVWSAITVVAYSAYVYYLHGLPPDELVMANTLSFQALVGLIVVGLPAVVLLFTVLLVGSIGKRWLVKPGSQAKERKSAA